MVETVEVPPKKSRRRWLRILLLVVVPLAVATGGVEIYLRGGRYIATDNAYVSAQKVLITPEISGTVDRIAISEGQAVKTGDILFSIDRKPYEMARAAAEAAVQRAANDHAALKENYQSLSRQIGLARETLQLRQSEVDRKNALLAANIASKSDVESDRLNLQQAKSSLAVLDQSRNAIVAALGGNADAPLESYAPYLAAKAALDVAQWNLDHTDLRAPMNGIATQVSNIQLGRYLPAGTPVFAIVSDSDMWIDANPKETDITHLVEGQAATVTVDAFPDISFAGHVEAISPGTGSQFSLIPAQNASGNWVKVVQRVPVRIALDPGQDSARLRAGMSASISIDTGRQRSLATLLGTEAAAQTAAR